MASSEVLIKEGCIDICSDCLDSVYYKENIHPCSHHSRELISGTEFCCICKKVWINFTGIRRYYHPTHFFQGTEAFENCFKEEITSYVNGLKEGLHQIYYNNGLLADETHYVAGLMHGPSKEYDYDTGCLVSETNYVEGYANGPSKSYYTTGELKKEEFYVDDKIEGLSKSYYKSGELKEETMYVNDKKDGFYKLYYKSGKLKEERFYVKDLMDGPYKKYDPSGTIVHEGHYVKVKKIIE